MLSQRNVSAANTAASHGCDSELGEVEIEIPGGFENILENDMSNSDFDDVSITSDISQNRKDWLKGVTKSHLKCNVCDKKFRNQVELVAHELSHESENLYKCPHMFCNSKYEKPAHLLSHIRKRHPKHWCQFDAALKHAAQVENRDEIDLLLQPTEKMVEALKPLPYL